MIIRIVQFGTEIEEQIGGVRVIAFLLKSKRK